MHNHIRVSSRRRTARENHLSPMNSQLLNISRRSHEIPATNARNCFHAKWSSFLALIAGVDYCESPRSHWSRERDYRQLFLDVLKDSCSQRLKPIDKWCWETDLIIVKWLEINMYDWVPSLSTQMHFCFCHVVSPERLRTLASSKLYV